MKKKLNKMRECIKNVVAGAAGCGAFLMSAAIRVYADDPDVTTVTAPLDSLKTLLLAIIGAVGIIILAKNVMEFAQAYQQQDSSTMHAALKGIVAGVIMAGISAVLTFLGF